MFCYLVKRVRTKGRNKTKTKLQSTVHYTAHYTALVAFIYYHLNYTSAKPASPAEILHC